MTDQPPNTHSSLKILGIARDSEQVIAAQRSGRVLTAPNVVTCLRLGLVPLFLVLALGSATSPGFWPVFIFSVAAGSDYLDGLLARLLGQYTRIGALLDPLVDRLLVLAGVAVAWQFELLPRWAIVIAVLRELVVVIAAAQAMRAGLQLAVSMLGRWSLWLVLFSIWLALVAAGGLVARYLFLIGLGLSVVALLDYLRRGMAELDRP